MPLIKITDKGTTTKLYKRDFDVLASTSSLLALLATHQPTVDEYRIASEAIRNVISLWKQGEQDERSPEQPATADSPTADSPTADSGNTPVDDSWDIPGGSPEEFLGEPVHDSGESF